MTSARRQTPPVRFIAGLRAICLIGDASTSLPRQAGRHTRREAGIRKTGRPSQQRRNGSKARPGIVVVVVAAVDPHSLLHTCIHGMTLFRRGNPPAFAFTSNIFFLLSLWCLAMGAPASQPASSRSWAAQGRPRARHPHGLRAPTHTILVLAKRRRARSRPTQPHGQNKKGHTLATPPKLYGPANLSESEAVALSLKPKERERALLSSPPNPSSGADYFPFDCEPLPAFCHMSTASESLSSCSFNARSLCGTYRCSWSSVHPSRISRKIPSSSTPLSLSLPSPAPNYPAMPISTQSLLAMRRLSPGRAACFILAASFSQKGKKAYLGNHSDPSSPDRELSGFHGEIGICRRRAL